MKKVIILFIILFAGLLLITSLAGCQQKPKVPVPTPAPAPAPVPPPGPIGLHGEIVTPGLNEAKAFYSMDSEYFPSEAIYMPGEIIEMEVRLTNISTGPVVIEQFPPKISIYLPDATDMEEWRPGKELGTVWYTLSLPAPKNVSWE